jgi:ATPase subunit of ABC transporter with duplicated ATPase domains
MSGGYLLSTGGSAYRRALKFLSSPACSSPTSSLASSFSFTAQRHASILSFKEVTFEYARNKPLIENTSFSIEAGSKVTIMGQNGSGKSTMLKLIKGELSPDSGMIGIPHGMRVAASHQVMKREDSVLTVLDFFKKYVPGMERGIERNIHQVLQTVELEAPLTREVKSFSGGQQARLLLASALIQEPDLLLLDEPTNNLDVNGIDRLTEFILTCDKTCLVISHDEEFLNTFTDSVLYLDSFTRRVESYDGNYEDVKREIAKRIQKENQDNARLAKQAQEKKDQSNKFKDKGGGLRKVAKRMREEAAKMEAMQVDVRKEDKALKSFTIPCQFGIGGELIDLSSVSLPATKFGGGLAVLPLQVPLSMKKGMRLHLKGPNGIGLSLPLSPPDSPPPPSLPQERPLSLRTL